MQLLRITLNYSKVKHQIFTFSQKHILIDSNIIEKENPIDFAIYDMSSLNNLT